jgi:nucleoside-diphosphate-sugar epimerase
MMRVTVLGPTGVISPRTRARGARRREQRGAGRVLRHVGIDAMQGDILDLQPLRQSVAGCSAALHLATAVPRPGQMPNWALNDRIRREGTANLLEACRNAGVRRYVQRSLPLIGKADIVIGKCCLG